MFFVVNLFICSLFALVLHSCIIICILCFIINVTCVLFLDNWATLGLSVTVRYKVAYIIYITCVECADKNVLARNVHSSVASDIYFTGLLPVPLNGVSVHSISF